LTSTGRKEEVDTLVLSLPRSPSSVRDARSAVRDALVSHDGALVEMSALLADELVANAVLHGEGAISLEVHVGSDCVRIAVADESPALPVLRPPDATSATGRGLPIVNAAATRWGVEATAQGKSVWFEMAL
jgi:anti-sigma regulatory factor (Ser/Thr protein kinase)